MLNKGLLGLLLLFTQQASAGELPLAETPQKNNSDALAELTVKSNARSAVICSNFVQNCTINISRLTCQNTPGFITVTNNSIISARNITASSTDTNFLSFVSQNNGCPQILSPRASCAISFISSSSDSFLVPNVTVKGTNTNTTFFNINALPCQTGALDPIPGSPFASGNSAYKLAATPNSKFLYVTNLGAGVTGYSIAPTTGILTPVPGSPFTAGSSPSGIAVSPNGNWVYVTNASSNTVSQFTINQTTGTLTPSSTIGAGSSPVNIAITPNGAFAYVANQNNHTISAYTIDATTGALTPTSGSPFNVGIGTQPTGITTSPNGLFVYLTDFSAPGKVYGYNIDQSTGNITAITGSPFATGTYPQSIITNSTGTVVYVAAGNGPGFKTTAFDTSIWVYSVASDGSLTNITPVMPTVAASGIALTPNGKFAYETSYQQNTITADNVDPITGVLTVMPNGPYATGNGPQAIIVTPNGLFVYVANTGSGNISGFVIG